jgi:hypothetical protein
MKLRRKAVFTDLSRERVGLSEGEASSHLYKPSGRLLFMAGAVGLAPRAAKTAEGHGPKEKHSNDR